MDWPQLMIWRLLGLEGRANLSLKSSKPDFLRIGREARERDRSGTTEREGKCGAHHRCACTPSAKVMERIARREKASPKGGRRSGSPKRPYCLFIATSLIIKQLNI
jgi:hypothetical protein